MGELIVYHIYTQSSDPFEKPSVNVNYFSVDWDLDVQIAGARLSRRILANPPLSYVILDVQPSSAVSPVRALGTLSNLRSSVGETSPGLSPPTSCKMLTRDAVTRGCYVLVVKVEASKG